MCSSDLQHADDPLVIAGRKCLPDEALKMLTNSLNRIPAGVRETTRVPLGTYRGLRFGLVLHANQSTDVFLEGATTQHAGLSRDHHGPRAILNSLERITSETRSDCGKLEQHLSLAQTQLQDYQSRLGNVFVHASYLDELTDLRDQLKVLLSHTNHTSTDETNQAATDGSPAIPEQSTVFEIAAKIKSLKATHTLESTPHRSTSQPSTAEEPVTTRIRRMTAIQTASADPESTLNTPDSTLYPHDSDAPHQTHEPDPAPVPTSFQHRTLHQRSRPDQAQTPA